jgi:signal transduction histidine kinase
VYGIVKQHQGKIEIQSEVNKGTTVTLIFPKKAIAEMG